MIPAFHHPDVALHRPQAFFKRGPIVPIPELPERADGIQEMLKHRGNRLELAADAGPGPRAAAHSPALRADPQANPASFLDGFESRDPRIDG